MAIYNVLAIQFGYGLIDSYVVTHHYGLLTELYHCCDMYSAITK